MPDTTPTATPADWLALGRAASMLGVDPDTLRRWADAGRVRSFTTPGGHRRFARPDLERVLAVRRAGRRSLAALGGTTEKFAKAYGREYRAEVAVPVAGTDDAARAAFRTEGRRLVETLLAYLDADDTAEKARLEDSANGIVDQTAQRLAVTGMSASEAMAVFVAARSPFLMALESLGRRRALDAPAVMRLYAEAATLLDRLLLRFVAAIQPPRGTPMTTLLPSLTAILALVMAIALLDQWRERRQPFQLVWAIGMAFFGIAAGLRGARRRRRLERGALPNLVPDRRHPDRRLARARARRSCSRRRGSATRSRSSPSSPACSRC